MADRGVPPWSRRQMWCSRIVRRRVRARRCRARQTAVLASSAIVEAVVAVAALWYPTARIALAAAVIGVGCARLSLDFEDRPRWLLALAGAVTAQTALRLPTQLPSRVPSALAAFAFALVLVVVASARVGLRAAKGGDTTSASPSFQAAEFELHRAERSFSRWFALPGPGQPTRRTATQIHCK